MDLAAAALCIGFASLMKFSSISKKMTCELLRRAIPVNDLKGLGEFLENNKIENPAVVVHGTVGSNSTVENSRLGVFVKERASLELKKMKLFVSAVLDSSGTIIEGMASLELKKMNLIVSAVPDSSRTIIKETDSVKFEKTKLFDLAVQESKTIFVSRKGSSLDDGTARVYVLNYQYAAGFYDTLKTYCSTEPIIAYFKSPVSDEKIKITEDIDCKNCSQVLEIGTYLTVVGRAERDKDGAPTIGNAFQFFIGHRELNELVTNLESESEGCATLSFSLTVLGAILLALNIMQTAVERS
ncbi:hypothetical protein Bca4012_096712 [Brassica carinata]|uniref:RING-type E3 ubiquitin transferase n=4 Tax=Brassica TaxID=3705 RepID=A0A816V024_BRANA|nr:hypothetical protein Bca52824_079032 [Brassica carinata]CAF2115322.1 unnamed protein product [Brassica napus]VDD58886.1 unnamed protein product [Brassica oleracea]